MNIQQHLEQIDRQFDVVGIVDLGNWTADYEASTQWLTKSLQSLHRLQYNGNQRIVILHNKDYYVGDNPAGLVLKNLQILLNEVDISNFFVTVVSSSGTIAEQMNKINQLSQDSVPLHYICAEDEFTAIPLARHPFSRKEEYQYGSANPIKVSLSELTKQEQFLLSESRVFCMYPWIHLHAWPTGQAYPCCHAKQHPEFGNTHTQTLKEIWNEQPMRDLRRDMLTETANESCSKCYEQEDAGFFSGRQSANKHHGHNIKEIKHTDNSGYQSQFNMTYWDIRFSNLCNLSCRSCGHIFSSSWYQDQAKIAGPEWTKRNRILNYAGRTETDMWEQLVPHLDSVEQIYFAGGEPLMMAEHYNILDELERRGRFDVRLIYNTNFTQTKLKDRTVFDYWKRFKSVAVGASLDAMGPRAEYIRKGTRWDQVERNRELMLETCPGVDFYISPTLSILNALHLPDFHRDWVDKGYIRPQDLNVNILQDPVYFRIDTATAEYKQRIQARYQEHLEWLRPLDHLRRATVGFESAINYMMSTDNRSLSSMFWAKTHELDAIRNENILEVIPELKALL